MTQEKPTIKEYNAMREGATDAPWAVFQQHDDKRITDIRSNDWRLNITSYTQDDVPMDEHLSNMNFIAASRNIAASLIRVIELAEEALNLSRRSIDRNAPDKLPDAYNILKAVDVVNNALSEIRKLRGE